MQGDESSVSLLSDYGGQYRHKRVLVTGGLGFIGSNVARTLVQLGARVTLVDSFIPGCGATDFNIRGIADRLVVAKTDLRDRERLDVLVRDQDIIFNLAGQVSHIDSMRDPEQDLNINCRSQLTLLEACRTGNPDAVIVYASTRQVYGRASCLPVAEDHPTAPTDINGINKLAGECYHMLYHDVYGMHTTALRLTNTYGPRQLMAHNRQGFLPWLVRLALEGKDITIFGDGQQLRDLTFIDDAVDAFLLCAVSPAAHGQVFNLGGMEPVSLLQIAHTLLDVVGSGSFQLVPFPDDRKKIDIGSFYADYSKITALLGWRPHTTLRSGLEQMIDYYRTHGKQYIPGP